MYVKIDSLTPLFVCVGEPDVPVLSTDEGKIEKNTYSVPIKQLSDGGSPITYYVVRYRMVSMLLNDTKLQSVVL